MRTCTAWLALFALAASMLAGCARRECSECPLELSTAQHDAIADSVREFAARVASDVTHDGPSAWLSYFSDRPAFFMAVNGQVAFASGAQARAAMPAIARAFRHIELHWGEDARVDPLTPTLAVFSSSWREELVDSEGVRTQQTGYFSGVVERRDGGWRFRDAHWSVPTPARAGGS
jgi:hypothetical protein